MSSLFINTKTAHKKLEYSDSDYHGKLLV